MGESRPRRLSAAVVDFAADRLAMTLASHLDVVEDLMARLRAAALTGHYKTPRIRDDLEKLRDIRGRVLEDLRMFSEAELDASVDSLRDLYAVISYYVDVAYRGEAEALRAAKSGGLDVDRDLAELEEALRLALAARDRVAAIIRSLYPEWGL